MAKAGEMNCWIRKDTPLVCTRLGRPFVASVSATRDGENTCSPRFIPADCTGTDSTLVALRGGRDRYPLDDRAVSLIFIQEVVGGIQVDPQQQRGMLPNTLLEQRKCLLTIAKLGMDQG
jgi:hypothetical protein